MKGFKRASTLKPADPRTKTLLSTPRVILLIFTLIMGAV